MVSCIANEMQELQGCVDLAIAASAAAMGDSAIGVADVEAVARSIHHSHVAGVACTFGQQFRVLSTIELGESGELGVILLIQV